jgi:hypothetical protein
MLMRAWAIATLRSARARGCALDGGEIGVLGLEVHSETSLWKISGIPLQPKQA